MTTQGHAYAHLLGIRIDVISYQQAVDLILRWAEQRQSRYVCCAAVNNIMTAWDDPQYRDVMNQADLVTSDGMPLVWSLRLLGARAASRVYGPDLTRILLAAAASRKIPVGFYGSTPETLSKLVATIRRRHPGLPVSYVYAPPFRPLSDDEQKEVIAAINASGTRILFVGLGAPKQERWMAMHRGLIQAVMLGVGAAFDFLAGTKPQAPRWMQNLGLEWLFRLMTEPRRLAPRYLRQNPRFIYLLACQLLLGRGTPCRD